jgi:hypothetical protein
VGKELIVIGSVDLNTHTLQYSAVQYSTLLYCNIVGRNRSEIILSSRASSYALHNALLPRLPKESITTSSSNTYRMEPFLSRVTLCTLFASPVPYPSASNNRASVPLCEVEWCHLSRLCCAWLQQYQVSVQHKCWNTSVLSLIALRKLQQQILLPTCTRDQKESPCTQHPLLQHWLHPSCDGDVERAPASKLWMEHFPTAHSPQPTAQQNSRPRNPHPLFRPRCPCLSPQAAELA